MPAAAAPPEGPGISRLRAKRRRVLGDAIELLEPRLFFAQFAVYGDMTAGTAAQGVANLIKSWNPAYIVGVGDLQYDNDPTLDSVVGRYFHDYVSPYTGSFGAGSPSGNRFWAAIGNHEYDNSPGASEYFDFFTFPGNERYYKVSQGNVDWFFLNSNPEEPHGNTVGSTQYNWLQQQMAASTATWKLVAFHHPAYSSATSSDATNMRWPFKEWGAHAVFAGHHHLYERLNVNGLPFFTSGLGGASIAGFGSTDPNSQKRYNGDHGAMLVDAGTSTLNFKFFNRGGTQIDSFTVTQSSTPVAPVAPSNLAATAASSTQVNLAWADNSNNETGFRIERSLSATSGWAEIATVGSGVTTYQDSGRSASTTYFYRVRANNGTANSAYSNTAQATTPASGGTGSATYIAPGAVWRYLDNGTNQGTAWRATSFSDSTWKSGAAQLGYGDGDEATVVGFGPSSSSKFITTYFRKTFNVADPAAVTALAMRLIRDDGAVVYLNGIEVWRSNMPSGTIGNTTLASSAISSTAESTWLSQSLNPALLVSGDNVLAVEIHQDRGDSSDIGFNAELTATVSTTQPPSPPPPPPPPPPPGATVNYIASGQAWNYLDNGTNQGTAWRATSFSDSTWKSGASQLGYGDGDEATVVSFGSSSTNKFITTYFRKSFSVADPAAVSGLGFRLIRDDGAVVYLNGVEVFRSNMPSGTVGYTTRASSALGSPAENAWLTGTINPALLASGTNVIAVEIHQDGPDSSDISFNFELTASVAQTQASTASAPVARSFFSSILIDDSEQEEELLV